ncbi:MAG TPA: VWA domain-containing protein [Pyrinomonadaceae bacterium]|nr:VWA domain-containing protein [Pyrinomonadaceae bacterium]
MSRFKALVLLLSVSFASVAYSQTPVDPDDVIRTDSDVTSLLLTATDKQRRFITTLRAEDLRVLEDGKAQQVFTFQRETDRPLALALLIDISASEERTLPREKNAARLFIQRVLKSEKDQAAVIPFTDMAYLEQPLTRDVLGIYKSLERVEVALPAYLGSGRPLIGFPSGPGLPGPPDKGSTAIWESLHLTARLILEPIRDQRRRAIILLTDGWDTAFESRITRSQAIDSVLTAEAVIYAIGIGDENQDGVNKGTLRDIAERTGGRAFFPKKEEDLNAAFAEIEQELRTQYLLAYSSTNKNRDGSYRQVVIEITNPLLQKDKVQLRHRPGYFARPSP